MHCSLLDSDGRGDPREPTYTARARVWRCETTAPVADAVVVPKRRTLVRSNVNVESSDERAGAHPTPEAPPHVQPDHSSPGASALVDATADAANKGDKDSRKEVLDFRDDSDSSTSGQERFPARCTANSMTWLGANVATTEGP